MQFTVNEKFEPAYYFIRYKIKSIENQIIFKKGFCQVPENHNILKGFVALLK